ncbi:MAG: hypothetical protein GKR99_09100 [Rhodobacteraceae bacterium]|nr:hypothetical protein [Paracoccaceae bacterium]
MSGTDTVSVVIHAPAQDVFDFMADAGKMTLWSFGTWSLTELDDGLFEGRALASNAPILLRIDPDPDRLLIDYHLGDTAATLQPRIYVRIVPGSVTGQGETTATLILTALRDVGMDAERWARMRRAHGFELDVIKDLIESGHDHRTA